MDAYLNVNVLGMLMKDNAEHRLADIQARLAELAAEDRAPGDDETIDARRAGMEQAMALGEIDDLLDYSSNALEALEATTPIWVPDTVVSVVSAIDVGAGDTSGLAGLGPEGLILFEKPPARVVQRSSDDRSPSSEFDLDGVLWWTLGTAGREVCPECLGAGLIDASGVDEDAVVDAETTLAIVALTRGDLLDPPQPSWESSMLHEATGFAVPVGHEDVLPGSSMVPWIEVLTQIGQALCDKEIGLRRSGSGLVAGRAPDVA
ncbi:hypothetical protein ACLQ3C_11235 [Gordonia sp. DT30]|uniref:hypothetical protein n=1 Tax=unclassified Gordonia (in: high G+C Gram-positive bacteria) TaxID=2657482 RepID=UPI003CEBB6BC